MKIRIVGPKNNKRILFLCLFTFNCITVVSLFIFLFVLNYLFIVIIFGKNKILENHTYFSYLIKGTVLGWAL